MNNPKEFEIDGIITTPEGVSEDEVIDAFLDFLESKGWSFGGKISESLLVQDFTSMQKEIDRLKDENDILTEKLEDEQHLKEAKNRRIELDKSEIESLKGKLKSFESATQTP